MRNLLTIQSGAMFFATAFQSVNLVELRESYLDALTVAERLFVRRVRIVCGLALSGRPVRTSSHSSAGRSTLSLHVDEFRIAFLTIQVRCPFPARVISS